MAMKTVTAVERSKRWPVDFDRNGHVRAGRTQEDSAPLAYAHGLPFIFVIRGGYALTGRSHGLACLA
ncbi:hypothetical protein N7471_009672 [Penicillium samsonianum]|uniref:uncharacterized protein n=1 Tax=Penicillium samsonianum TaxID=1882272 RepID=UPI002548BACE|nr:uncharacterized protein N7471_009672 [Penicillium samsonianum]KAJ6128455.1 hypothetical protein N7471_009672 [Penicillium samsonianum]